MNILIKLTCLIGLVIAPILGGHSEAKPHAEEIKKEISLEVKVDASKGETTKTVQIEANTIPNTPEAPKVSTGEKNK